MNTPAPRRGRPPIPEEDRRTHEIKVSLNPAELARLDSERGTMPRGRFLREAWQGPQAP